MAENQPRPLLLLHGFPMNAGMWRHTVERFGGERTVIAPEAEELFGSRPDSATIQTMGQGALEALDRAAPGATAVVVGLSMGGYVAMEFARRFPDRLAGLVLCDTRCNADTEDAKANRDDMIGKVLSDGVEAATKPLRSKLLSPGTSTPVHEEIQAMAAGAKPQIIVACLTAMRDRRDYCFMLENLRQSAMVVRGADDALVTLPVAETMVSLIPNGRYVEIPNAGHVPPLENPKAFNDELALFLSTNQM